MYEYIISGRTYRKREEIKKLGLWFDDKEKVWKKSSEDYDQKFEKKLLGFCRKNGLKFTLKDMSQRRSSTYRDDFFRENRGLFDEGEYYICAYCGKIKRKKDITVDHIIPVKKAMSSKAARKMLQRRGIEDVNDTGNLAAACRTCNSKKGTKGGFWALVGAIGSKTNFWIIANILLIIACIAGFIMIGAIYGGPALLVSFIGPALIIAGCVIMWIRHKPE